MQPHVHETFHKKLKLYVLLELNETFQLNKEIFGKYLGFRSAASHVLRRVARKFSAAASARIIPDVIPLGTNQQLQLFSYSTRRQLQSNVP
jgi:hypothetical protein